MARLRITEDEVLERPFNKNQFMRLLKYLSPYKGKIVLSLILMVLSALASLSIPYLNQIAIDECISKGDFPKLVVVVVIMIAAIAIAAICFHFRIKIMDTLGRTAIMQLRQDLFAHIQGLSFKFFDARSAGKIMVRVINDVNSLNDLFTNGIVNIIIDCVSVVLILVLMLSISIPLTLVALSVLPVMLLIIFLMKRKMRLRWQSVRRKISNMNGYLNESLSGMRVTQAFVREDENFETFTEVNTDIRQSWMKAIKLNMFFGPGFDITNNFGVALVYIVGVGMITAASVAGGVETASLTMGNILAIIWYLGRFWEPLNNLSNIYNNILVAMASMERVFEIMDTPADIADLPTATEMPSIAGHIAFEDVVFSYDPEKRILDHVSFDVAPGQTIALVGPTGAGKSTIVNLVSRFYDVDSGHVRIDGHDVRDVTLYSLRSQMGIMMQDSFIFSGTIADNIRYGRTDATEEEIIEAAKAVEAHEFIMQMEKGYQTEVNERGSRLSIGQRQLISFARALLADPRILILDEATSSIDTHTEMLIQKALARLLEGRTSFVIAHRLSTIRQADRIMVVAEGNIIESGTHEELLALKGHYYELCQAQYRFLQTG